MCSWAIQKGLAEVCSTALKIKKKYLYSTNVTFLENDYVINFKPRSKVVLEELRGDMLATQPTIVVEIREEENTTKS